MIYLDARSALAWTWAKKKLAGTATVRQDGDQEGILTLTRLPVVAEAEIIRGYIGLHQTQTRNVTPETMQRLRGAGQKDSVGPFHRAKRHHRYPTTRRRKIHELDLT